MPSRAPDMCLGENIALYHPFHRDHFYREPASQKPPFYRDPLSQRRRDPPGERTWDKAARQEVTSYRDPPNRMTDRCKNITMPPISFSVGDLFSVGDKLKAGNSQFRVVQKVVDLHENLCRQFVLEQGLKSKPLAYLKYHITRSCSHQCEVMTHGVTPAIPHFYSVNGLLLGLVSHKVF